MTTPPPLIVELAHVCHSSVTRDEGAAVQLLVCGQGLPLGGQKLSGWHARTIILLATLRILDALQVRCPAMRQWIAQLEPDILCLQVCSLRDRV